MRTNANELQHRIRLFLAQGRIRFYSLVYSNEITHPAGVSWIELERHQAEAHRAPKAARLFRQLGSMTAPSCSVSS
jgi:hypothetical protein